MTDSNPGSFDLKMSRPSSRPESRYLTAMAKPLSLTKDRLGKPMYAKGKSNNWGYMVALLCCSGNGDSHHMY